MPMPLHVQLAAGLVASVTSQRRRAHLARRQAAHARALAASTEATVPDLRAALHAAAAELDRCGWGLQAHSGLTSAVLEELVRRPRA